MIHSLRCNTINMMMRIALLVVLAAMAVTAHASLLKNFAQGPSCPSPLSSASPSLPVGKIAFCNILKILIIFEFKKCDTSERVASGVAYLFRLD